MYDKMNMKVGEVMDNFTIEMDKLKNKLDNAINSLQPKQPYIKYENLKLYFKVFSPSIDVIQSNENCFQFKYFSKNIKKLESNKYKKINDAHDMVNSLCNDIDSYLKKVEQQQIIKEITFSFNCEHNRNFLDLELCDRLSDKYINDKLISKYEHFNIINKIQETNSGCKLYEQYIEKDNNYFYEYFLMINSLCINMTLNTFCNSTMSNLVRKLLLSCSFSKELVMENLYLGITKEELDLAFEIEEKKEESLKKENTFEKNNLLSDENNKEFKKLNNLLANFELLKNDSNFNDDMAFNILLLGNDTAEKNFLLNSIKDTFRNHIENKEKINIFELDMKKDSDFFEKSIKKMIEKLKLYNFLIIHNFDMIEEYDTTVQLNIINSIINLENYFGIVVCGDTNKTLDIVNKTNGLEDKFSFRFKCKDYDMDTMYNLLISKLSITNYKITLEPTYTKKVIKKLLLKSTAKNEKFLNNLYTKMLKYVLENEINEFGPQSLPSINQTDIINNAMNELNSLIGLGNVKDQVNKLIAFWKFKNETNNITNLEDQYYNIFLVGNSGTGKTTIAKLIEKLLYSLNYISEDKFIEITPNDLLGDYLGQTKTKTREILNQSKNGILFIDEAYLFLNNDEYFKEALVELLKYMENPKNIVLFAGYPNLMDNFLNLNSGLKSRIATIINFDDYSQEELIKILKIKLKKQNITIDIEALEKINDILSKAMKEKNFGNARYIDKLITKLLMKHAENIYLNQHKNLLIISKDDVDENEILNDKIKKTNNFGFTQKNGDV